MSEHEAREQDPEYRPKWENRKRTIFGTLAFCAGLIIYLTVWGEDTQLNESIATMAFVTSIAVIGTYVFNCAYEDALRLKQQ